MGEGAGAGASTSAAAAPAAAATLTAPTGGPSSSSDDADGLGFRNSLFSVRFSPEGAARQWALGREPYGVRYEFALAGAVDHVDEYLVPWELLERLAAAAGLVPIARDNFHAFFARWAGDASPYRGLLARMGVLDCEGTLSADEWEAAGLYRVFAFQAPLHPAAVAEAVQQGSGGASASARCTLPPLAQLVPPSQLRVAGGGPLQYLHRPTAGDIADLLG